VISDLHAAALAHVGSTAATRIDKAIARHHDRILRRLKTIAGDDPEEPLQQPPDRGEVARALDRLGMELQSTREQLDRLLFDRRRPPVVLVRDVPGNLLDKQALLQLLLDCEGMAKKLRYAIERPLELGPLEWDLEEFDPGPSDAADPPEVRRKNASEKTTADHAVLLLAECWQPVTGEWPRMIVSDSSRGREDQGAFAAWVKDTLLSLAPEVRSQLRAVDAVAQSIRRLREEGHQPRRT
jgi:hypothetical protein